MLETRVIYGNGFVTMQRKLMFLSQSLSLIHSVLSMSVVQWFVCAPFFIYYNIFHLLSILTSNVCVYNSRLGYFQFQLLLRRPMHGSLAPPHPNEVFKNVSVEAHKT